MKIEKFASKIDRFGVIAFLYVIIYSIILLVKEVSVLSIILPLIGLGGFLVDLYVVINTNKK